MQGESIGIGGLVTVREMARLLGVTKDAVRQRIHRKGIPVVYVGQAALLSLADMERAYPRARVREEETV